MITSLELANIFTNKQIEWKENQTGWVTAGDDTQYCFLEVEGENILLFALSNSKTDWKNNFSFWKKPYKHMETKFYVHGGFLKCWKLVEDEIIDYIKEKEMDNLTIAGWSYGGAMSILCTESVWFNCKNLRGKTRTVTFGAPRVFSVFNFRKIKERFENVVMLKNGSDIVTKLPPVIFGFKHVVKLTNIGDSHRFIDYFNPWKFHNMEYKNKYGYHYVLYKIFHGLNIK